MTRSIRVGLLFAFVGAALAAACSGGGGGGGAAAGGSLDTGNYTFSNYTLVSDSCASLPLDGSSVDGSVSTVTVAGSAIQILGLDGTYLGKNIEIQDVAPFDWTNYNGFDCQQTITSAISGLVTTTNAFDAILTYHWEKASGAECTQALADYSAGLAQTVTLPCDSKATFHLQVIPPPPVTPTPTPQLTRCEVYWLSTNGAITSDWDAFVLDAPITDFTTGTHSYDSFDHFGEFLSQYDPNSGLFAAVAIASSGTYSLTVPNGTGVGSSIDFADTSAEVLYDASNTTLGAVLATGGDGTFTGTISDFSGAGALVPGSGSVRVTFGGVTRQLGALGSYAGCY